MLIVFEGIHKIGKSTHALLLAKSLLNKGYQVRLTSEPSKSRLGWLIYDIEEDKEQWADAEYLTRLKAANRYERVYAPNGIRAALHKGEVVISDQYLLSDYVYQYEAINLVKDINYNFPVPDLLIYLESSEKTPEQRVLTDRYRFFLGCNNPPSKNKFCFGNINSFSIEQAQEVIEKEVMKFVNC